MTAPRMFSAILCFVALVGARPHEQHRPDPDERSGWRLVSEDSTQVRSRQVHQAKERHWSHPQRAHERWVEYDLSELPGYTKRKSLFLRLDSTGFRGVPHVELASSRVGEPRFQGAFRVGEVLEIEAQVQPGDTVTMPIPLPDALQGARVQDLQVVHLVDGNWRTENVVEVRDGAAWTRMTSFSPVAVGLAQTYRSLAAGGGHLLWVRSGRVWSAGANDQAQLGVQGAGNWQSGFAPVYWPSVVPVVAVAAGLRHSLALDSIGNVWAWGDNRQGQCGWPVVGANALASVVQPLKVVDAQLDTSRRIVQIAAGDTSSYALTASGKVLSWGANGRRQLGRGGASVDSAYEVLPKYVTKNINAVAVPLEGVLQVAAGAKHTLVLLSSGVVQGWGGNDVYQLGPSAPSGNLASAVDVRIPRELYGTDTIIASGCTGPDSTGCWSQTILRPMYELPSQIGAGGNSSYAKLYRNGSQGLTALNLVWGANDSGRIPTSANPVNYPYPVSGRGQNLVELGRSHLLEAYNAGSNYFPPPIGAVLTIYPVFARGANLDRQSDPTLASNKVSTWKEILRPGAMSRMMSSAIAAGSNFSASWDSRLDSVYVWGGAWGVLQKPTRTDGSFLEIVSHKDGDTIPRNLDTVQVVWRRWTGSVAGSLTTSLVVPVANAQGKLVLTVASGANTASVVVVRGVAGPSAKPMSNTFDRRLGQNPSFVLNVPYDARKVVLQLWSLRDPSKVVAKSDLGAQAKGVRTVIPSAWTDANGVAMELRDGSYGVSVAFQFVGQKVAWDTLAITKVGTSENWVSAKLLNMAIPNGGPDSFQVSLPGRGVLAGYLLRMNENGRGVKIAGAWDLRDSGSQFIAAWNVSDSSNLLAVDTVLISYIGWYYRFVESGFRVEGSNCIGWLGMNSTQIDAFMSEVPVERVDVNKNCAVSSIGIPYRGAAVVSPARSQQIGKDQEFDLGWFWPNSIFNGVKGAYSLCLWETVNGVGYPSHAKTIKIK